MSGGQTSGKPEAAAVRRTNAVQEAIYDDAHENGRPITHLEAVSFALAALHAVDSLSGLEIVLGVKKTPRCVAPAPTMEGPTGLETVLGVKKDPHCAAPAPTMAGPTTLVDILDKSWDHAFDDGYARGVADATVGRRRPRHR